MSAEKIDPTENTPVHLSGAFCARLPIGTELVGSQGYWKGASYVKTAPNTWAMFHKRPTPEQIWEAVEGRKNNLSPHPSGSAYVYEPPAKPGATIDPSKVKVGDTVTLRYRGREDRQVMGAFVDLFGDVMTLNLDDEAYSAVRFEIRHHWTLTAHEPAPQPEWKPGTVGTATVRGVEGVRVIRASTQHGAWFSANYTDGFYLHPESMVTAFAPDDAEALRAEMRDAERSWTAKNLELVRRAEGAEAEVERLRAARTLPTREQVTFDAGNVAEVLESILNTSGEHSMDVMDTATRALFTLFEQGSAALRAEVTEYRKGYEQQNQVIQTQHRALLDIWHMCEPGDTKYLTYGQDPERVFETVKTEVERLRSDAEAWEGRYHEANHLVEALRSEAQAAREVSVSEYERAEEFFRQVKEEHKRVDRLRRTIYRERQKWSREVTVQREEIDRLRVKLEESEKKALPIDLTKCICSGHFQDAGGGPTEHLTEYEPACPIHSEHLYDPKSGLWTKALREPTKEEIAEALWPSATEDRKPLYAEYPTVRRVQALFNQEGSE